MVIHNPNREPNAKLRKLWAKLLTEYDYRAEELQG